MDGFKNALVDPGLEGGSLGKRDVGRGEWTEVQRNKHNLFPVTSCFVINISVIHVTALPGNYQFLKNGGGTILSCEALVANAGTINAFAVKCAVVRTQKPSNLFNKIINGGSFLAAIISKLGQISSSQFSAFVN